MIKTYILVFWKEERWARTIYIFPMVSNLKITPAHSRKWKTRFSLEHLKLLHPVNWIYNLLIDCTREYIISYFLASLFQLQLWKKLYLVWELKKRKKNDLDIKFGIGLAGKDESWNQLFVRFADVCSCNYVFVVIFCSVNQMKWWCVQWWTSYAAS